VDARDLITFAAGRRAPSFAFDFASGALPTFGAADFAATFFFAVDLFAFFAFAISGSP
jgi:hypothetical protein